MTKIAWTDETWNPVIGCSKVSEGCLNCYAEKMAYRLACMGNYNYQLVSEHGTGKWLGSTHCIKSALDKPLHWKKPRRIFVCSMGDLFHESVPFEFIWRVWEIMAKCQLTHTFQILTKRPQRLLAFNKWLAGNDNMLITAWPRNVWLGVTAENQRTADKRIPILLQIPAAVRFVSVEPMLEHINLRPYLGECQGCGSQKRECPAYHPKGNFVACCPDCKHHIVDWVIVGCESGPKRRECKYKWMIDIVNQCKSASVPVFVKQLSINGKVSKNMAEWPEELRVQEYPNGI